MSRNWIAVAALVMTLASGCQCCPLFDCYANFVDDVNDTHVYFDRCYNPRWDITRMGKPDWCSPVNNHFCSRCCQNGCYDRYDECYLYPPSFPYDFPSSVMPPPTVKTTRMPPLIEEEVQLSVAPQEKDVDGNHRRARRQRRCRRPIDCVEFRLTLMRRQFFN